MVSSTRNTVVRCDGDGCNSAEVAVDRMSLGELRRFLADHRGWEHGRIQSGAQWRSVDLCRGCARHPPEGFHPTNPRRSRAEMSAGVTFD
jgi:hypothetical protein